jgi:hypothetical protein
MIMRSVASSWSFHSARESQRPRAAALRGRTTRAHLSGMNPSRTAALSLLFLLGAAAPQGLSAQAGPGAIDGTGGWAPPSLGVRAGYDNKLRKYLLGAQLRLPVLRGGQVELMPSVDVSFLRGRKEQQYNLEAVYVWDGRAGGLYAGAGLGIRNGVFGLGEERRSELGYTIVGGFRVVSGWSCPSWSIAGSTSRTHPSPTSSCRWG